jgi:hypothetical protein
MDDERQYFHPEDELFLKEAEHVSFPFTNRAVSDKPSFNTLGLLILSDKAQFETAIANMESFLGTSEE